MSSPYPNLQVHPTSGLSFPWVEHHPDGRVGSFDIQMGPDGVTLAFVMLIRWVDLATACKELLGYSWRDDSGATPILRRVLPWQHPYTNQLWVKNIASVKGIILREKESTVGFGEGGVGAGFTPNTGPWSNFELAQLTIHFWRPPYFIRSDADILDDDGNPQEWLRYVDKNWELSTSMLSREGNTFLFAPGQGTPPSGGYFQGSVGQKISKLKVKRTWYQIPERALFQTLVDATPNGLPLNMLYTQTPTTNPITGYYQQAGYPIAGCVNSPKGGGWDDSDPTLRFFGCYCGTLLYEAVEFIPRPLQLPATLMQIPQFGKNEAISQTQYDVVFHWEWFDPPAIRGSDNLGKVLAVGVTEGGSGYSSSFAVSFSGGGGSGAAATAQAIGGVVVRVMITNQGSGYTSAPTASFAAGGGTGATADVSVALFYLPDEIGGHNLMPFSGNGLWYAIQSQQAPVTTPFQYADFTDLFKIL